MLIEKIIKIGSQIKKQNRTHARHVFSHLERKYNVFIPYVGGNDSNEEEKKDSKKVQRKSTGKESIQRGNSDLSAGFEMLESKTQSSHKRGSRGKRKSQGKQNTGTNEVGGSDNIFEKAKE
eukprot:CAMPEP_0202979170 /NCGR_PEP_ID=MMETSP1396-20130829/85400_1 /ASSEMBLY_ACC=CAM_ASM_000872 /TAXON_ID= /ORGANISM="Pseudokeronopsis sp., Strain Brazil" /LENGTH=120 /DNA_ID=CAMNT_0049718485 /DNA_START=2710 /DNA_END=3072 /DNA_ORIENTATION=+